MGGISAVRGICDVNQDSAGRDSRACALLMDEPRVLHGALEHSTKAESDRPRLRKRKIGNAAGVEIRSDDVQAEPKNAPRDATAHVEAPRGVLIHDYKVDAEGIVTGVNLIVATQQNMASINDTIAMSAAQFLECEDETMLNGIEFGIRCYDPCLSCATHRLGEMKLEVVVRRNGRHVRTARR